MTQKPLEIIAGDPNKPLVISEIEIPCYVLEDKSRVITQRGLYNALGISRGGARKPLGAQTEDEDETIPTDEPQNGQNIVDLPRFAQHNWLSPYIQGELSLALKSPISFYLPSSRIVAYGFPARVLTKICRAILKAHNDGNTTSRQLKLVRRVEILLDGFADIGILGLVDEITGYEKVREEQALATILESYIAEELRPWIKIFPDAYYMQIYRLWEIEPSPKAKNHPQFIGKITNKLIYAPLAPGVLEELRRINPMLESGNRAAKHHQYLTENHGVMKLKEHLASVVAIMRISSNRDAFERNFQEAFFSGQIKMTFLDDPDD